MNKQSTSGYISKENEIIISNIHIYNSMITTTFSQYPKYGVNVSTHQWMKKNPPHKHMHTHKENEILL